MICFFCWTFYSKIVQTELQGSLESAKILKCCCQCAILFEWSVNQTETLVFWEPVGSFNFCLENAWTWKGRRHHCFGGIPWIMVYWSGFLVPGGPIWCFLGFPGEYRVPVCEAVHFLGKTWLILGLGFWHIFFKWLVQLHAIPDHFLENKSWVDDELHFHVPIFLKICTCRTGINISRKWLDQAPKNIDLYRFFLVFQACDLWLFR